MKSASDIRRYFQKSTLSTNRDRHDTIFEKIQRVQDQSQTTAPVSHRSNLGSHIMKSPVTKVAAAAVIVLGVLLSTRLWDSSVPSAYAVEQTFAAMRTIKSMHVYSTGWDGGKGETWIQINPETGHEEYYRAEEDNFLIVGTPQATYYYNKDKNLVRIRNKYMPASEVRFSRFFEDIVEWVRQHNGELSFHSEFDEDLGREVIVVWAAVPAQGDMCEKEGVIRVDSQTKLPISYEAFKGRPEEGTKSVDRIEYNVTLSEGLFEFEIPDGAEVVYSD